MSHFSRIALVVLALVAATAMSGAFSAWVPSAGAQQAGGFTVVNSQSTTAPNVATLPTTSTPSLLASAVNYLSNPTNPGDIQAAYGEMLLVAPDNPFSFTATAGDGDIGGVEPTQTQSGMTYKDLKIKVGSNLANTTVYLKVTLCCMEGAAEGGKPKITKCVEGWGVTFPLSFDVLIDHNDDLHVTVTQSIYGIFDQSYSFTIDDISQYCDC